MYTGIIKKLSDKGFGFLTVEGRGKDLFFHSSALEGGLTFNSLREGDKVVFKDITNTGKGDSAVGIELE